MAHERSTVIVTGGAGFIGSELIRQITARGERVVIVDNLVNGKRENVADVLSRDVVLMQTDIRDIDALTPVLRTAGTPEARRDEFSRRVLPDDVYGLAPATWSDVDPALVEPGLVWSAWKAATVLDRRRREGRR